MEALPHESVRCLDCANVYAKPSGHGTMVSNPGCPHCGYVGWATMALSAVGQHARSAADRLQGRLAPRG